MKATSDTPLKFTYGVEEFKKKVYMYFKDCEEVRQIFPDESGMLNALDIEDEEYAALKETEGYDKVIRWARRRRTSWLERQMVANPRAASGCMNALKQEKNGGYSDKPQTDNTKRYTIKLEGLE